MSKAVVCVWFVTDRLVTLVTCFATFATRFIRGGWLVTCAVSWVRILLSTVTGFSIGQRILGFLKTRACSIVMFLAVSLGRGFCLVGCWTLSERRLINWVFWWIRSFLSGTFWFRVWSVRTCRGSFWIWVIFLWVSRLFFINFSGLIRVSFLGFIFLSPFVGFVSFIVGDACRIRKVVVSVPRVRGWRLWCFAVIRDTTFPIWGCWGGWSFRWVLSLFWKVAIARIWSMFGRVCFVVSGCSGFTSCSTLPSCSCLSRFIASQSLFIVISLARSPRQSTWLRLASWPRPWMWRSCWFITKPLWWPLSVLINLPKRCTLLTIQWRLRFCSLPGLSLSIVIVTGWIGWCSFCLRTRCQTVIVGSKGMIW